MTEEVPKQDMLLKLLKMTTSDNDGEALVAIRKANSLLKAASWDWDKLIAGKIKVVADPFAGVNARFNNVNKPPPPPNPQPQARPYSPPPPGGSAPHAQARAARQPPQPPKPLSSKPNIFPNACYVCGDWVAAQDGFIFDPAKVNRNAKSKWHCLCKKCVATDPNNIYAMPAPRKRPAAQPQATPNLSDL